jgi:hypothetical protein
MEDKSQNIFEQNDIFVLSIIEISNNNKCLYDSFDFQEINVQDNFKVDETLGFQRFNYHRQVKSFDKESKQEQNSQTSYSEICNNHDYKNDISTNYDKEYIVVIKHPAIVISY